MVAEHRVLWEDDTVATLEAAFTLMAVLKQPGNMGERSGSYIRTSSVTENCFNFISRNRPGNPRWRDIAGLTFKTASRNGSCGAKNRHFQK